MKRNDSLKRGKNNIDMILLSILTTGELYGYQLAQLIKEYSDNKLSLPEGSLYPSLYRMEEAGYVKAEKRLAGKRLERIYYTIQPSGREYLKKLISDYDYLNAAIHDILSHQQEEYVVVDPSQDTKTAKKANKTVRVISDPVITVKESKSTETKSAKTVATASKTRR